jgi:hypothetical protein
MGIFVPALFVFGDHWLLTNQRAHSDDPVPAALMLGIYVVEIGLLGLLCAHVQAPSWLRWMIYLWCWALIDLQTFTAWSESANNSWAVSMLSSSLFAAQLGMAMIWAVLGDSRWTLRLPIAVLAAGLIAPPLLARDSFSDDNLAQLFLSQIVTLLAICGVLRWQGFRLSWVGSPTPDDDAPASPFRGTQFGVRDVLIWMTSLAFLLAVLRALDLLSGTRLARFDLSESIALISAGMILAMTLVVGLWAALGRGKAWVRTLGLAVACLAGGLLHFLGEHLFGYGGLLTPRSRLRLYSSIWEYWQYQAARHWWQVAWVAVAGGLLFASLLFLRGVGYQLSKSASQDQGT